MNIVIRQPLCFSEIGDKDNQEDYLSPQQPGTAQHWFVLCDGMGGYEHGEIASRTVCEAIEYYFSHEQHSGTASQACVQRAIDYAYDCLDEKDQQQSERRMGTTMTCVYLHADGLLAAHIGDSRIYHIRPKTGKPLHDILFQSHDHSLVNQLIAAGELTPEQARTFPRRNVITRAMQPHLKERYEADFYESGDIKAGDYIFMCSDGVLEQMTDERLCEILAAGHTDEDKLRLIKEVCSGKTRDNYSCWLIPIDRVECAGQNEEPDAPSQNVCLRLSSGWNKLKNLIAKLKENG